MRPLPSSLKMILLLLVMLLAAYPLYGELLLGEKANFFLQKLSTMMILAVFAMSLDLLVGMTGLVSLGHALFFGLSGYVLALIVPESEAGSLWITLPICLAASAGAALVVGALCIRTSGIYFIMVTLAFGQMLFYFFNDALFTGGSDGMYIYFKPSIMIGDVQLLDLDNKQSFFYVTFAVMIGVYLLLHTIMRSPFGHVIFGIHANEHRIRSLGYNVFKYKLVSFVLGGTLAGLAGYFAAAQFGYISPGSLGWHTSGTALMVVILGGMGTLFGPAIGAFVFELLQYGFESMTEHWLLLMGAMVIAVVLLLPNGIASLMLALTQAKTPVQPLAEEELEVSSNSRKEVTDE